MKLDSASVSVNDEARLGCATQGDFATHGLEIQEAERSPRGCRTKGTDREEQPENQEHRDRLKMPAFQEPVSCVTDRLWVEHKRQE